MTVFCNVSHFQDKWNYEIRINVKETETIKRDAVFQKITAHNYNIYVSRDVKCESIFQK